MDIRQMDRLIHEFEMFVDTLNDPALDADVVADRVRAHRSAVMWCQVAGLCDEDALSTFDLVLFNNLWVTPWSLAERRVSGQLDELLGG